MLPSFHSRLTMTVCLLTLVIGGRSNPIGAASATFADPAGLCAGSSPCFLTLQEAVDNAGPAPATIDVFPGIFAESVDLTGMGSAIGQGVGDLTIQGVDATGAPATGLATVDPAGPGGPGSGPGLSAIDPNNLGIVIMSLTVRGLKATSPDLQGLIAFVSGDVEVSDLAANGCGDSGIVAVASGSVTARNLSAVLNVGFGIQLGTATSLDVAAVTAEHNDAGIVLISQGSLDATDLRATANNGGIGLYMCNGAQLENLQALSNVGTGIQIQQAPPGTSPCDGALQNLVSPAGMALRPGHSRLDALIQLIGAGRKQTKARSSADSQSAAQPVRLINSQALNNGEEGLLAFVDGPMIVSDFRAEGNGFIGMGAVTSSAEVASSVFDHNGGGAAIAGQEVTVASCRANDNIGSGGGFPGDGYGFAVGAETAALSGLEGSRNIEAGLALGTFMTQPGTYEVDVGTFEDNRAGVEMLAGPSLPAVTLRQVVVRGNQMGVLLPAVTRAELVACQVEANAIGLRASPTQSLAVTQTYFAGNQVSAGVDLAPGAVGFIHCSSFTTSASGVGLELLSASVLDATANFWGSPLGPTHPANPGAAGEAILDSSNGGFGSVSFKPFLEAPATAGDCTLGADPVGVPMSLSAWLLLGLLLAAAGVARLRAA